MFVIASTVSRGLRFFLIGGLIWKFGAPIKVFIDKYFNLLASLFTVMLIGFTALALWLFGSGEENAEDLANATTEIVAPIEKSTTDNNIEIIEPCDTLR